MNKTIKDHAHSWYKWFSIAASAVAAFLITEPVNAKQMRFCTYVTSDFVDAGGPRVDSLNNRFAETPLPFAYVKLTNTTTNEVLWDTYLNSEGCTDFIEISGGQFFEAALQTRMGTVGNRTFELPQDGLSIDPACGCVTTTCRYWCEKPYFEYIELFQTDSSIEIQSGTIYKWKPQLQSPRIQLMLVGGRLLANYDVLNYSQDTKTIFKVDGQFDCDLGAFGGAFNYGQTGDICATSMNSDYNNRHAMTDASYYKFVTGHELGHRVQYANTKAAPVQVNGHNYAGWDSADVWVDDPNDIANQHDVDECRCDQVQPADGSRAHCFQSREPIWDAIGEGYAHFFSAALFNDRPVDGNFDQRDCWFAYCKQGYIWLPVGTDFVFQFLEESAPVFHHCSNYYPNASPDVPPTERHPWMENECNPGNEDLGVERDWLSFYWHLYADDRGAAGEHRFNIGDILTSFGDGNGEYSFQKSYNAAKTSWETTEPDKYFNFRSHANEHGVVHCKGGCVL